MTSTAQLVAEELDADWKKVKIEYADTNEHVRRKRAWGNMQAVGSQTIRTSQDYLRKGLAMRDDFKGESRLHFCMSPHAPYTVSDRSLTQTVTLAEQLQLPREDWSVAFQSSGFTMNRRRSRPSTFL